MIRSHFGLKSSPFYAAAAELRRDARAARRDRGNLTAFVELDALGEQPLAHHLDQPPLEICALLAGLGEARCQHYQTFRFGAQRILRHRNDLRRRNRDHDQIRLLGKLRDARIRAHALHRGRLVVDWEDGAGEFVFEEISKDEAPNAGVIPRGAHHRNDSRA